ncbi:c-type cytochrome [Flavobacterium sp.]|jgi:cytochrome c|uniref:c-type cytochrome n=1 Tax=Flavobacterium sp. TaxID=239 RepID=UPI0037BFD150
MKKLFFLFLFSTIVSCGKKESESFNKTETKEETPIELGEKLFNGAGMCYSCHKPEQKIIGPSIVEIAKIYKDNNANIVDFLKEKADPIVDPTQYEVMKTNFAITKKMSDEELKAIELFMYSFLK